MTISEFVHEYGYYAVLAGTFFEGELVMLAAGIAACAGVLNLAGVILAGMLGIFASDTLCFFLGRFAIDRVKRWFPSLHARLGHVLALTEHRDDRLIIYFQFFPGLCTITPVAYGMTRISTARFMALDLLGNTLWTLVFSIGGYFFGRVLERFIIEAHRWELMGGGSLIFSGFVIWGVRHVLGKRRRATAS